MYRLGIHPYEFWHMSTNNISISRIMYSKMPTKRKIRIFFGFGWPSTRDILLSRQQKKKKRKKKKKKKNEKKTKTLYFFWQFL